MVVHPEVLDLQTQAAAAPKEMTQPCPLRLHAISLVGRAMGILNSGDTDLGQWGYRV